MANNFDGIIMIVGYIKLQIDSTDDGKQFLVERVKDKKELRNNMKGRWKLNGANCARLKTQLIFSFNKIFILLFDVQTTNHKMNAMMKKNEKWYLTVII